MTLCPLQFPRDTVPLSLPPLSCGAQGLLTKIEFFQPKVILGWDYPSTASKGWILARSTIRELGHRGALHLNCFALLGRSSVESLYQRKNIFPRKVSSSLWKLALTPSSTAKQARGSCMAFPCCQTNSRPRRFSTAPRASLLLRRPPIRMGCCCQGKAQIQGKDDYICMAGLSNQTC